MLRERLSAIVIAAIVLASAFLGACGAEPVEPSRDPSVAITPTDLGSLRFEREDGVLRANDAFGRRPILVHFWATWCVPCRRELPALLAAARDAGVGDRVLAVSTDGSWEPVRAFFEGPIPAQVVREPDASRPVSESARPPRVLPSARRARSRPDPARTSTPVGAVARALGVSSLPDTYLIDAQGRATRRIHGALDWSRPEHRAWLAATLAAAHD